MTPQERSLLANLLTQLTQIRSVRKDAEAAQLIAQAVEQQPDAAYLLVQRVLLMGQALDQAKARIAELEQSQAGRGQGFLDANASGWGNTAPTSRGQASSQQSPGYGSGPNPQYGSPPAYPSSPSYAPPGFGPPG